MPYSVTPHRANLVLQMLLQANTYVSVVWAMSYLIHMLIRFQMLWNLEGLSLLVAYVLAVAAEAVRLYAGYSVNLCSGATAMWLLLTVTPCILLPAMVFLRLSSAGRSLWLRIITNAVFALIGLEVIVSVIHFVICMPGQKKRELQQEQEQERQHEDVVEERPASVMESVTLSEQRRRV
ncbi:transmembrane protein 17B isoform X1 [Drosophila serrata]|uniref:transmembrane protein 17B isoform X1 n=1 Tax=Drosophila serrata TaxID=7274 RepID=UPI000A1CF884|nr:transmembrane protein 17B isoform X1 [Drosophila serrata]